MSNDTLYRILPGHDIGHVENPEQALKQLQALKPMPEPW